MNLHEMVDRCQQIIISSMKDASPECTIVFARDRVDETNLIKVVELANSILEKDKAIQVGKALEFMRKALSEICEKNYEWALNTGKIYGRMYNVSDIDAKSLALEGLYKATIRFKPIGSFRSYATSWIRQVIQRSKDHRLNYTLDAPIQAYSGGSTTRLDQTHSEASVWGKSHFFARDPFVLEDLRLQYCDHLSMKEMKALLCNKELAESVGC